MNVIFFTVDDKNSFSKDFINTNYLITNLFHYELQHVERKFVHFAVMHTKLCIR